YGLNAGADPSGTVHLPADHRLLALARRIPVFDQSVVCSVLPSDELATELRPLAEYVKARSMICAPLVYEEQYLGIIALGDQQAAAAIHDSTRALLSAVATQTATRVFNRISFQRLQESGARFRQAFDHAASGLALVSLEGRFFQTNRYLRQMLDYSGDELKQMTIEQVTFPEDQDTGRQAAQSLLSGATRSVSFENRYLNKNGQVLSALVSVSALKDVSGNPLYFIAHIHDLTRQKKTEAEKKNLEKSLQQAQKMEAIGTLAGGIAHDFNNILSGVGGYTELALMKSPADGDIAKYLQQIKGATERATDLVRQILTFSRQSGQKKVPMSISPILQEALKLVRASLPATIAIHKQISQDRLRVIADPTQIHQIVMNLCTNALHAMEPEGGVLSVRLRPFEDTIPAEDIKGQARSRRYLLLSISDTGCGMDAETRERIFDPYFTTKDKDKGTGLGLAVVHGIVESMGGKIRVDSVPGRGTTFEILLPVTAQALKEEKPVKATIAGGTEQVLFVDDESSLVELGRLMLEKLGYRVTGVTSPHEALENVRQDPGRYDLVVTDLTMPGLKGDRLAEAIKKINPAIPVLICSGYSQPAIKAQGAGDAVDGYIDKPITFEKLAQAVQKALSGRN
ncbi:MAG: PAS domain S-box protein, partial [Desulfosarcina sp.]|nr:PAS domain S-box protein [Desulfobacterales bacterium]